MQWGGLHKADEWIERVIFYPGIDDKSLTLRKNYWVASLVCTVVIICLTIVFRIIDPQQKIAAEMSRSLYISLYAINLLWISSFALLFAINLFSQSVRIEQLVYKRSKDPGEAKTKLSANITSEFRTPLTIILGMVDIIRAKDGKDYAEELGKIEEKTMMMLRIVNQMPDVSKDEAGEEVYLEKEVTANEAETFPKTSDADSFMQRIQEIMAEHLNDDFDIRWLCNEMGMSRTQLYRKFKSHTEHTISEYCRSFRLHKARELLLTSDIRVSEAAYRTGFSNLSHFSKAFTKEFGINPGKLHKRFCPVWYK